MIGSSRAINRRRRGVLLELVCDALIIAREAIGFLLFVGIAVGGTIITILYLLDQLGGKLR